MISNYRGTNTIESPLLLASSDSIVGNLEAVEKHDCFVMSW